MNDKIKFAAVPIIVAFAIALLLTFGFTFVPGGEDDAVEKARISASTFMERLQGVLMEQMRIGGPAVALSVCSDTAQVLTKEIGTELGVDIRRVSDRVRNPMNRPDAYERSVLDKFIRKTEAGGKPPFIHYEVRTIEGTNALWYMQSIHIQPACLSCHGTERTVNDDVRNELRVRYPDDAAVGYSPGELRGAIRVIVPLDAE
jgi:hypothetical protein